MKSGLFSAPQLQRSNALMLQRFTALTLQRFTALTLFRVFSVFRGPKSLRSLRLIPFLAFSAVAVAAPKIQFAAPIFDFGHVKSGEVISHTFICTNVGDQLLELTDVRPSCGCTTAGSYDRTIEPGKTASIPIRFDSGNYNGTVGKTVIVQCNDPLQTNIVLQIKGTVWKPVDIVPAIAWFGTSTDSETNITQQLQIVSNLQEALELSPPECTNGAFQPTLKTIRPGKEYELVVTFLRPSGVTNIVAPITLQTTSTNLPVLTITAYGVVQAAVVASPAQLMLPPGPLASAVQLNANILNNGTGPLVLSDPSIEPPVADVRVRELNSGRQFLLTANFHAGFNPHSGQTAEIRLKTNHPQYPLVRIPVVGGHSLAAALRETDSLPTAKQIQQQ